MQMMSNKFQHCALLISKVCCPPYPPGKTTRSTEPTLDGCSAWDRRKLVVKISARLKLLRVNYYSVQSLCHSCS